MLTRDFIYKFINQHSLAVVASVFDGKPQSAIVGIAVTEELEIIFDTVRSSRKYRNLVQTPYVSLVIGWDNETTIQYEGVVRELQANEDDRYREIYYTKFPDGRKRTVEWDGLVHFVVKPVWLRYSAFSDAPVIEELTF